MLDMFFLRADLYYIKTRLKVWHIGNQLALNVNIIFLFIIVIYVNMLFMF